MKIKTLGISLSALMAVVAVIAIVSSVLSIRGLHDIESVWGHYDSGPAKKTHLVQELKGHLGYGGMIHQFKNYVLRQDEPRIAKVEAKVKAANAAIASYLSLETSQVERDSLKEISAVIDKYAKAVRTAESLVKEGKDPRQVDKVIKISDGPALKAFTALEAELLAAREEASSKVNADVVNTANLSIVLTVIVGVMLAVSVIILAWFAIIRLGRPLENMTEVMTKLASGDLNVHVPAKDRKDEIGQIAHAMDVFKDNAKEVRELEEKEKSDRAQRIADRKDLMDRLATDFEDVVGQVVNAVAEDSASVQDRAQNLSQSSGETRNEASTVSTAADHASANVQTVATATTELTSSIEEISRQVTRSTNMSREAVDETEKTNARIQGLAEAASKIGEVVSLITDIAEQTNLLALNATIEAARAGDAGKGFAVVASEVKNLASQTAKATEEISAQVAGVQQATGDSVAAIGHISGLVREIAEVADGIAAAVDEQASATNEIARNVEEAASGTEQVSMAIGRVTNAADEAGTAATNLLETSNELEGRSHQLEAAVKEFLNEVRSVE